MRRKVLYILRGVSGAGKSYMARLLEDNGALVCCADDYFTDENGNYNFDANLLLAAHKSCQVKALNALSANERDIVIANTNTEESQFKFYLDAAKKYDYDVVSLVVENRHGGKDSHNVPAATLEKQENRIRKSLKLR